MAPISSSRVVKLDGKGLQGARRLEDLGTKLDWVAVDHHSSGHPHCHLNMRSDHLIGREHRSSPTARKRLNGTMS
ncbi:hypothetical protein B5V01_21960 [Mesorhizobium erdmanii]|uniref:Uncharacterized protein n=2 Tax=Mesorhizobium TaxID=68287 RepID=A0A3M9X5I4_9HYPH|nr:hypothetical protein DNR46_26580 [Mesorhizobium japonicum]RXT42563.1 hypothetical protein B5V01_21960 [Mesorhizobium erdmanii]